MTATAKQRAEIVFVGVTTDQYRPGKKLTKSLFRQIVMDDPPKDGNVEVLGWVNYWPSKLAILFKYEKAEGGKGVGWFSPKSNDEWLHVLWRTSSGELRRFFMHKPAPPNVQEAEDQARGCKPWTPEERLSWERYYDRFKKLWDTTMEKGQLYLAGI